MGGGCLPSPMSSSTSCQSYSTSVKRSSIQWSTLTLTLLHPQGRIHEQMWCPPPTHTHTHRCVFSNPRKHYQGPPTASLTRGGCSLLVKMKCQSSRSRKRTLQHQSVRARTLSLSLTGAHAHTPQYSSKVIQTCDAGTAAEGVT